MPKIQFLKVHVKCGSTTVRHNATSWAGALDVAAQYPAEAAVLIRTRVTGRILARRNPTASGARHG